MSNDFNSIRQRFREVQEDDVYLSQELERMQRQREEEARHEAKLDFRGLRLYRELTSTSEPMSWRENPEKTDNSGAKSAVPAAGNPGCPPGGNMWSYSAVAPSALGPKRQPQAQQVASGVTFYGANGGGKSGRMETYESAVKSEGSEGKKSEGKKAGGGFASWLLGGPDQEQHLLWDTPEYKAGEAKLIL
ncbi:hypothetical protein CLOP_g22149 [Closterium sp. NIES-67]|nr:hypothetical protein CLOP_g22149 [Closterium sp. NIES-67]